MRIDPSVSAALVAVLLFGASTPFARALVGAVPPILLAGPRMADLGVTNSVLYGDLPRLLSWK